MNKNDLEKTGKNSHTIEITLPFNGAGSISSKKEQKNNESDSSDFSDDTSSKKGQMSNQSDGSDFSDDAISKKGQKSNESDASDSSDATSKKAQLIINIK